jgi:hypothetical protein
MSSPTPITVTATVFDPGDNLVQGNAFVRFRLRNFDGLVPIVYATGVFVETQIDAFPNSDGLISQTLWANSVINGNTYYTVEFHNNGRITSSGNYNISGNTNLNTAATISPSPVPSGPNTIIFQNNGAMNSSQTTLNLENTDGSITITDEGGGTLNIAATSSGASFSTAGQGFFLGAQSICGDAASIDSSGESINTDDVVYVMQLNLEAAYTVRSAAVYVITSGGSPGTINVGIYSESGAKLLDSGALNMATASSQQFVQATLGSPIVIGPGTYWFAFASTPSGSSSSMLSQAIDQFFVQMVNEISFPNSSGAVTRFGTAANVLSGGALPATLGTITPAAYNATNIPAALFLV